MKKLAGFLLFSLACAGLVGNAMAWQKLGEKKVDFGKDQDKIEVGKGKFTQIRIRVKDAPVEIHSMVVKLGNGDKFKPDVKKSFRANSQSGPIDLPGKRGRSIKSITFEYESVKTSGKYEQQGKNRRDYQKHRDYQSRQGYQSRRDYEKHRDYQNSQADRRDWNDPGSRTYRSDRNDRNDRGYSSSRDDRSYRNDRSDRGDRNDRNDQWSSQKDRNDKSYSKADTKRKNQKATVEVWGK
jgi:hypothetical protein